MSIEPASVPVAPLPPGTFTVPHGRADDLVRHLLNVFGHAYDFTRQPDDSLVIRKLSDAPDLAFAVTAAQGGHMIESILRVVAS